MPIDGIIFALFLIPLSDEGLMIKIIKHTQRQQIIHVRWIGTPAESIRPWSMVAFALAFQYGGMTMLDDTTDRSKKYIFHCVRRL